MRQIKFRLWDNEENKYFEPIYEAYKGKLLDISITLSGELQRRTLKMPAEHESLFPDRYILEQFTGLTDKNGKEIVEGDIFRIHGSNYSVEFYEKYSLYAICRPIGRIASYPFLDSERGVVIGNIHENPELLQQ